MAVLTFLENHCSILKELGVSRSPLNRTKLSYSFEEKGDFYKKITAIVFLFLVEPFAQIGNMFVGLFWGALSLLPKSFYFVESCAEKRRENLTSFGDYFSKVYLVVLKIFIPQKASCLIGSEWNSNLDKTLRRPGILTNLLYVTLSDKNAFKDQEKTQWKTKAIMRANYLVSMPLVIITRIVDFAMGMIAAIISLATAGRYTKLNAFAYSQLKVLAVVEDLFGLFRSFLYLDNNPTMEKVKGNQ